MIKSFELDCTVPMQVCPRKKDNEKKRLLTGNARDALPLYRETKCRQRRAGSKKEKSPSAGRSWEFLGRLIFLTLPP